MTAATQHPEPSGALLPKPVSFEQFIDWYPEESECRYELRCGVIVPMPKPRGKHSEIAGELAKQLNYAIDAAGLSYFIPRECIVKVSDDTGYEPDVIVLDREAVKSESLWEKASALENGATIQLIVEVVSTNWQDDYEIKLAAYERLGIPEYWIVDYTGLGGVRHLGKPKQPTLTVGRLVEGEYEVERFRGEDRILSSVLPGWNLTASSVLEPNG